MSKAKVAILYFLVLFSTLPALAVRQNNYPIVLVHGLFGWGRDEVFNVKYWGGLHGDIQNELNQHGYQTFTAAVGPVSSNWDRACELYAYIKGGTVDYGKVHSAKMRHARYGRSYPGIYREWGLTDQNQVTRKIHLVGHSQGGQTIRLLAQLMSEGSIEEIKGTPKEELSPLFQGSQHWISSVTALFTPHNGTSLADAVGLVPLIEDLVKFVAALGGVSEDKFFYDFKLDQWGLSRRWQESFADYKNRVMKSQIWKTRDIASYDLSTEGAKNLNGFAKAQPDIFYFSASGKNTWRDVFTGYNYPEVNMIGVLKPTATLIGSFSRNQPDFVRIDSSWWPNDGLVPVSSGKSPTINSQDKIVEYNGKAKAGYWNYLGLYLSTDHTAIVGWNLQDPNNFFRSLADKLGALPK